MRILISAVGDTDPIRNFHDGALVHIARKYRPDKIIIIFSERTISKKENIEQKSEEAPVKKKKLAVVFHSQNSVNHKNHPLGRTQFSDKAKAKVKKEAGKEEGGKKSPNGRPLPPGTARVTPLKALNAIQKKIYGVIQDLSMRKIL